MAIRHFFDSVVSFLTSTDSLSIPFGQVLLFVIINSYCLLLAKYKLGLLITYCFVFYWGFISNREYFIDRYGNSSWGMIVYVLAGIFMVIIFIISFFQSDRQ